MALARMWGADGAYGPPGLVGPGANGLRLIPAHGLREIGAARRMRADAILLSPAFPTRSHPGRRHWASRFGEGWPGDAEARSWPWAA
jgi:thiamine-phosphate pyrophosphorylase